MPELPEVETIVLDLNKKIIGKKIKGVEINLPKIVQNKKKHFLDYLIKNKVEKIDRRGKLIIFYFSKPSNLYLLVHLKMTGQLIYKNNNKVIAGGHSQDKTLDDLPNKYSHVIISYSDQEKLIYNDVRQFGYLKLVDQEGLAQALSKFGVEPLGVDFTQDLFENLISKKKKNIKAFLLDQDKIAGIGNIYADEILFESGVLPDRNIQDLSKSDIKNIYINIKKVLQKAVKYRGTTFNDYRDADGNKGNFVSQLKVYGRDGEDCKKCNTKIEKTKVAGRGTHFCPKCQK